MIHAPGEMKQLTIHMKAKLILQKIDNRISTTTTGMLWINNTSKRMSSTLTLDMHSNFFYCMLFFKKKK